MDYINLNAPHVPSVVEFLKQYDPYEGRRFDLWELDIIFKNKINETVFKQLSEDNQNKESLRNGQITLKYLINSIETSRALKNMSFQYNSQPNKTSVYEERFEKLDKTRQEVLKKIAAQRDISYDPVKAYDKFFGNQD